MATSGGEGAAPTAQYDKFGFLVAADRQERANEYKRRDGSNSLSVKGRGARHRSPSTPSPPRRSRRSRSPMSRAPVPMPASGDSWEAAFDHPPQPQPPPPPTYIAPAPSYSQPAAGAYCMEGNYGQQFSNAYNTFPDVGPPPIGHNMHLNPEMSVPLAPTWGQLPPPNSLVMPTQDEHTKREAIASELRNQCATLGRQKDDYIKKVNLLKKELDTLKEQKAELRGDNRRTPSPNTQRFLKENSKLQTKLQSKIKTMNSIIDMLNGIIENNPASSEIASGAGGDKSKNRKSGQRSKSKSPSSDSSSSDNEKHTSRRKRKSSSSATDKKFNYAYYDPEMHWCRVCNEFPANAKDYLTHLHTPQHQRNAAVHMEAPWHNTPNLHEGFPTFSGAPIKRTPIKGLQFFVPSTAWYCKLCDQWIGDLHCASAHLKSIMHSKYYTNFIELNPHWEMDWMSDRQKNFEKSQIKKTGTEVADKPQYSPHTISFQGDSFQTKSKKADSIQDENTSITKTESKKERKKKEKKEKKKKKKRSVSESSDSSSSSDERSDSKKRKKSETEKAPPPPPEVKPAEEADPNFDDRLINQWMSVQDTSEQDRKMLEEVKNRVKSRAGERTEQRVDGRVVSREREARALLSIRSEKVRSDNSHSSKNDNNDREKEKDYRSYRDKDRDRDRERDRDRDRDRDRRSDRSHRNRDDRDSDDDRKHRKTTVVEKRYIMDTEFKPYPSSKRDNHDHGESRFDKQVSKKKQSSSSSNNSNSNDSKKMPFIGKMPLYKSLGGSKPSKGEDPSKIEQDSIEVARKKRDEINAHFKKSVESFKEKFISNMVKTNELMESGLFPEPKLIIPTGLHGHPPLLDISEMMIPKPVDISTLPQTIHRIQPITYSAPAAVVVTEPIIAATPAAKSATDKNSALHKDFQDALDIIFPSEAQKEAKKDEQKLEESEDVKADQIEQPMTAEDEELQMLQTNMAASYQGMIPGMMTTQDYMSQLAATGMIATPSTMGMMMGYEYPSGIYDQSMYDMSLQTTADPVQPPIPPSKSAMNQDMEDLAMLGIDAEDVGASGF